MKKLALFMTALLVGSFSYAGLSAGSINTAWKAKNYSGLQLNHDINIVYGGQDVSLQHAGVQPIITA